MNRLSNYIVIDRLDPRIKLAAVFFFSLGILLAKPAAALFLGVVLLFAAISSGITLPEFARNIRPLLFFIILIFLVHLLFDEGGTSFKIPFARLSFSLTGLTSGILVTWQFICLILTATIFTLTTKPASIIAALKYYLQPLKLLRIPVDILVVMVALAMRMLPVLITEKERIEVAQKARCYSNKHSGILRQLKSFSTFAGAILLRVFKRTDEMATAMEARNFHPGQRSSFIELHMMKTDLPAVIILSITAFIFMALNFCFG